jgi:hypothetical protein
MLAALPTVAGAAKLQQTETQVIVLLAKPSDLFHSLVLFLNLTLESTVDLGKLPDRDSLGVAVQ